MNNKIMLKNKRDCYLKNRIEHFDIFRRNTPYHFVFIQINLNHVYDLKNQIDFSKLDCLVFFTTIYWFLIL